MSLMSSSDLLWRRKGNKPGAVWPQRMSLRRPVGQGQGRVLEAVFSILCLVKVRRGLLCFGGERGPTSSLWTSKLGMPYARPD